MKMWPACRETETKTKTNPNPNWNKAFIRFCCSRSLSTHIVCNADKRTFSFSQQTPVDGLTNGSTQQIFVLSVVPFDSLVVIFVSLFVFFSVNFSPVLLCACVCADAFFVCSPKLPCSDEVYFVVITYYQYTWPYLGCVLMAGRF